MAYFDLNDIKRERVPYQTRNLWHCNFSFFNPQYPIGPRLLLTQLDKI